MSEHLNFETDFLDKATSVKKKDSHKPHSQKDDSGSSYNWGKILLIGGGILFFLWIVFSDDTSSGSVPSTVSSNSYQPTASQNTSDDVATGQYRCSQYNHDRANSMEPSKLEGDRLESEGNSLSSELDSLSSEKNQVENEYVDEYSQDSIDAHNASVDSINSRLASFRYKRTQHTQDIDDYNAKVETYNNFLIQNCRPR